MAAPIRVGIADDHALFRQGLRSLLLLQKELVVTGETDHADGIEPMLARSPCDVLLLDLQMDRQILVDIGRFAGSLRVIVVTASELPDDALEAIRAGAHGVVFKRFAVETLMDAIRTVMSGEVWMPPSLQSRLAENLRAASPVAITPREREVIRNVALGLRNAEVAHKLFISEQTVKTHLNNVFQKLGLRDRVELTLYAVRTGIIGSHERRS